MRSAGAGPKQPVRDTTATCARKFPQRTARAWVPPEANSRVPTCYEDGALDSVTVSTAFRKSSTSRCV